MSVYEILQFAANPDDYVLRLQGTMVRCEAKGFSICRFFSRLFYGENSSYYLPAIFNKIIANADIVNTIQNSPADKKKVFIKIANKFISKHQTESADKIYKVFSIVQLISKKGYLQSVQPSSKELKLLLGRLRHFNITQQDPLTILYDLVRPTSNLYKTWYDPLGENRYSLCIQENDAWQQKLPTEKLCLIINSEGVIQSVLADSTDTMEKRIPNDWLELLKSTIWI